MKKNVLVVDDYQSMRSMLRRMLAAIGFEHIISVGTGEEALAALRAKRFDILVCDYNLGDGIDGQQLLEQARAEGVMTLSTVFVMVTAESSNEMVMGALEFAPDAYVSKPFTKDLLNARIGRALRRREPLVPVARALKTQGPAAALEALNPLLAERPGNRLELLRIRAELAFTKGDLELSDATCCEAMEENPLAWALTQRGRVAEARRDVTAAESFYRESMTLTPHFMAAHDRLAALCRQQGRTEEALSVLRAALERSPKSLQRQRNLAQVAAKLGQYSLALPAWKRSIAIARQMGLPDAADYLGLIKGLVALGNFREARQSTKLMRRRCSDELQLDYWEMAARFWCLMPEDAAALSALSEALDALLQRAPVPKRAGLALAEAVAHRSEIAHYPTLAVLYAQEDDA